MGSDQFSEGDVMIMRMPFTQTDRRARCGRLLSLAALAAGLVSSPVLAQVADEAEQADAGGDIVVTAQRRSESASKVPISMATYSQEVMDRQGIRKIDDLSRLTPSLNFNTTAGVNGNNGTNIAIRGVASDVGSATTAIYIDDTPIQIRSIGYLGGNPYPRVFDLERVEVLRGPQGTLFGAGAEGGAVRFITPQPNFDRLEVYGRGEIATIDKGSESYEAGIAVGGPISSTLAFRASGWFRRDGGYIDQVTPQTNSVIAKDFNTQETTTARLALAWKPADSLTVTPALYYQKLSIASRDEFWAGYGDKDDNDYKSGVFHKEPSRDRFFLPSLKVELALDTLTLVSNTSYFDRKQAQQFSYTTYQSYLRTGNPFGFFANKNPDNSDILLNSRQKNFVQELRLFSSGNRAVDWLVGAYYSKTKQSFVNLTESGRTPGVLSGGFPQYLGKYSFYEATKANDEQIAGYANVNFKASDRLKLAVSARYTHNLFKFEDITDGPINANVRDVINTQAKENAFTPKVTATFQATRDHMLYATASKGFRPGGAQPLVSPEFCASDLQALGIDRSPSNYDSDSLWNYELGSKNKFLGNRVTLDASVYVLKWKNIQQSINLPTCNFNFIGNLGSATGKGAELSLSVTPVEGLQLGGNFAYTHITFDDDVRAGNGGLLRADGQRFGGPLWTGSVFGQLDKPISDRVTGYLRADYSFAQKNTATAIQGTYGYDPDLPALPGTNFVSLRAGARFDGIDLSLFADNLTNSRDLLARNHDGLGGSLYYHQAFRPRTVGLTAQIRY